MSESKEVKSKRPTIAEIVEDMLFRLDKIDPENILDTNEFKDYGVIYDEHDNMSIHPDDIELLDSEENFEDTPSVLKKSIREILSMRYKRKSRLFLISNIKRKELDIDDSQTIKITAIDLVLFNRRYQWVPKIGIYGKWRMRSNTSAYIKEKSIVDRIREIKEKKWALNRFKNRTEPKFKKNKFNKIIDNKLIGKSIDSDGNIIKE